MILLMETILPCISGVVETTAVSRIRVLKQREQKELKRGKVSRKRACSPGHKCSYAVAFVPPPHPDILFWRWFLYDEKFKYTAMFKG